MYRIVVMGKQLVYFVDRMSRYFLQYCFHPFKGIDVMQLTGAQQGVKHSATLCGFMAASEQIVLPTYCHWPYTPVNLSTGVTARARLQNRTCLFQGIRLLGNLVLVMNNSCWIVQ